MKAFVTLTLLILFLFSPCSSDASYLASPSWDFNIANLVKHTDLVVLGKVKDMRLIPRTYSTSITLEVETVIKGDKTVGDSLLGFTVFGDAGQNDSYGIEAVVYFTRGDRVLLFMWEDDGDYHIYHPSAKAAVEDNKVYMPYTYKKSVFTKSDNEMAEIRLEREVELPLDLVVKIAKASIKDYDAIKEIEADVAKAVSLTEKGARPSLSVELLKRFEDKADQILEKQADEWVGTWSLESVDGERFEQRVWDESFSHLDRETATFINNWTFNDDGMVQSEVGFTIRDKPGGFTSSFEGIYTLSGENYRLIWTPPTTKDSPLLKALFILLLAVRGEDKGQDTGTWSRQGDTLTIISTDSGEVMVFKKKESNEP